ncbi:unnamed protein product, partial [Mesorhabditis belari]|uniref:C-type lectin domain-containing protein n=1 Tax=Mesorhabditis belari TaxID=2138241 RepID=A0AAF3F051_9BILA
MCLFPLFRCCNDVDQIKQRLNLNAKRYECMPNPLNKWSLATRTPDPYKGNSTFYSQCQSGFTYQPDLNQCLMWMNDKLLSFTESRTRCNSFGGELISIHNAFQNGLLAQMQNDRGWLGAVRDRTDHPWFWMDQTPFDYQRFQSQAAGGYCAYLDSSDQLWKIVDCNSEAMYALCAAQPVDQTTQAPTVCQAVDNQPLYNCLKGWQYSPQTGYQYLVFFDQNFTTGEAYCQSQGGHLASIHSDTENDFVTSLCCKSGCTKYSAQPPFYLGAFLVGGRKTNGQMVWTDGTPFDYQHPPCYEINDDEAAVIIVDHYDCGYGCYPGAWLIAKPFTVDVFPYLVCKKR